MGVKAIDKRAIDKNSLRWGIGLKGGVKERRGRSKRVTPGL